MSCGRDRAFHARSGRVHGEAGLREVPGFLAVVRLAVFKVNLDFDAAVEATEGVAFVGRHSLGYILLCLHPRSHGLAFGHSAFVSYHYH